MKQELFPWRNKAKWIDEWKAQKSLCNSKLYLIVTYFILAFAITGCISVSAFTSLFGIPIELRVLQ